MGPAKNAPHLDFADEQSSKRKYLILEVLMIENDPYLAIVAARSQRVGVATVEQRHDATEPPEFNFRFVVDRGQFVQASATDATRQGPTTSRINSRRYKSVVAKPEVGRQIGNDARFRFKYDRVDTVRRSRIHDQFIHRSSVRCSFVADVTKSAPNGSRRNVVGCRSAGMRTK